MVSRRRAAHVLMSFDVIFTAVVAERDAGYESVIFVWRSFSLDFRLGRSEGFLLGKPWEKLVSEEGNTLVGLSMCERSNSPTLERSFLAHGLDGHCRHVDANFGEVILHKRCWVPLAMHPHRRSGVVNGD